MSESQMSLARAEALISNEQNVFSNRLQNVKTEDLLKDQIAEQQDEAANRAIENITDTLGAPLEARGLDVGKKVLSNISKSLSKKATKAIAEKAFESGNFAGGRFAQNLPEKGIVGATRELLKEPQVIDKAQNILQSVRSKLPARPEIPTLEDAGNALKNSLRNTARNGIDSVSSSIDKLQNLRNPFNVLSPKIDPASPNGMPMLDDDVESASSTLSDLLQAKPQSLQEIGDTALNAAKSAASDVEGAGKDILTWSKLVSKTRGPLVDKALDVAKTAAKMADNASRNVSLWDVDSDDDAPSVKNLKPDSKPVDLDDLDDVPDMSADSPFGDFIGPVQDASIDALEDPYAANIAGEASKIAEGATQSAFKSADEAQNSILDSIKNIRAGRSAQQAIEAAQKSATGASEIASSAEQASRVAQAEKEVSDLSDVTKSAVESAKTATTTASEAATGLEAAAETAEGGLLAADVVDQEIPGVGEITDLASAGLGLALMLGGNIFKTHASAAAQAAQDKMNEAAQNVENIAGVGIEFGRK